MNKVICPRCKSNIDSNEIRCPHCGMRINTICPECETVNYFGSEICSGCGAILIKYCGYCGSSNMPESKVCRKCSKPLSDTPFVLQKCFEETPDETSENKNKKNTEINEINQNIPVKEPDKTVEIPDEKTELLNDATEYENDDSEDNIENEIETEEVAETEDVTEVLEEESKNEIVEEQETAISDSELSDETDELSEIPIDDNITEQVDENNESDADSPDISDINVVQAQNVKKPELIIDNDTNDEIIIGNEEEINEFSDAQDLLNRLVAFTEQTDKKIVAICGEEGMGKTTIINALLNSLSQKQILGFRSECSELTKIAPFGCIRDSLLRLLSLPDFHPDMQTFLSDQSKQLFASNFEILSPQEIIDFMNFLYPSVNGDYKDLYNNKIRTHLLLEKVLKSISAKNNVILVIDNFDLIDSSSYEFINNLIKNNKLNNKLIISYQERRSVKYYFDEEMQDLSIFETLAINNMNEEQSLKLVHNFVNTDQIPEEVLSVINTNGKGNIFFAEQYLALLFDTGYLGINQNIMSFNSQQPLPFSPQNTEELIKDRLNLIQLNELKESLYTASILGYKFNMNVFGEVMEYTPEQTQEVLKKLCELMYLYQSGHFEFSFKNMTAWNVIFDEAQTIPNFKPICKKIYYTMGKYGLSNITVKATIAKYRDEAESAFQSWKAAADTAAYLGDEYIYTTCYEQWLAASGYSENAEQITDAQIHVLECLGKLYSFDRQEIATKYLIQPILFAQKQGDIPKMIELSAYMIKSCDLTDNYNGIIETVDMIMSSGQEIQPVEKAIILSKKMKPLFILGNCEEAINLANNDLLPVIEEELSKNNDSEYMEQLFDVWFDVSLNLANTYSLQGNTQSLAFVSNIEETLKMNNIQNEEYQIRLNLSKAFGQIILGSVNDCFETLNSIDLSALSKNKLYKSRFNLILSFAQIISGEFDDLKEKLFEFAKYSDDNFDKFGKHMFKLIFATILFLSGDYQKSIEIYNEELNFFAKEKIVTGALLSWLFIARINLLTGNSESAENVAAKALEVAHNPKFSQYHISIYLQKLIAEANIVKGDVDAAKMYIEKGTLIAKQFGLELAKTELYSSYIKLLEQVFMMPESDKIETVNKINQIYKASLASLQNINSPILAANIQQAYSEFINYCQQNSLQLA